LRATHKISRVSATDKSIFRGAHISNEPISVRSSVNQALTKIADICPEAREWYVYRFLGSIRLASEYCLLRKKVMRLLQFFFATLWVIGYVGNGLLFLYVEWIYLRQSWIQIFNPFLQIQVLLTLLSTPLFWLLLAMAILGYYLTTVIEERIDRKSDKNDVELDKTSSISPPIETSVQPQVLPSHPRQVEKDNLTDHAFIKQQIELLEWAIQSSQKVQFDYENRYGAKSHRTITPIQFKTVEKTLYLEAYCHLRKARRTFAVERMKEIRLVSPDEINHHAPLPLEKNKTASSHTASRASERLYIKYSADELERIANSKWNSLDVLKDIHYELGFRSRRKAHELRERISKRLAQLQSTQFIWPTTVANIGSQSLPSDAFKHEEGLLRHYGYKVGIHGLNQSERLEILDSIFLRPLILMDNREYLNEWGEPKTARRLQKLAESIAAFTRNAKRRNETNFSKAIQDWEADLAYLKKTYYDNRCSFRWPRT
jgi:hypothetical protein